MAFGLAAGLVAWMIAEGRARRDQLQAELAQVGELRAYADAARKADAEIRAARRAEAGPEPFAAVVGGVATAGGGP